jgi:hypothetical protein
MATKTKAKRERKTCICEKKISKTNWAKHMRLCTGEKRKQLTKKEQNELYYKENKTKIKGGRIYNKLQGM